MALKTAPSGELLTASEVCRRLNISKSTFYGDKKRGRPGLRSRLIAKGLKTVKLPTTFMGRHTTVRYTASSIEKLIQAAAQREAMLC